MISIGAEGLRRLRLLLAMNGARVYDLDDFPAKEKNWWELENPKVYYEFFKKNAKKI